VIVANAPDRSTRMCSKSMAASRLSLDLSLRAGR
jgi:hypothetical protein